MPEHYLELCTQLSTDETGKKKHPTVSLFSFISRKGFVSHYNETVKMTCSIYMSIKMVVQLVLRYNTLQTISIFRKCSEIESVTKERINYLKQGKEKKNVNTFKPERKQKQVYTKNPHEENPPDEGVESLSEILKEIKDMKSAGNFGVLKREISGKKHQIMHREKFKNQGV